MTMKSSVKLIVTDTFRFGEKKSKEDDKVLLKLLFKRDAWVA